MTCCLMAPSHHLSQFWLIISQVQWYWPESNFTRDAHQSLKLAGKCFYLRFHSNLPWANELKFWSLFCYTLHSCSQCCVMLACRITQLTLKCIFSTNLMLKIWRGPDNQITIYGSARQMHINTLMWQKQLTLNPFVPKSLSASTKKWKGNRRLRTCQNLLIWCSL